MTAEVNVSGNVTADPEVRVWNDGGKTTTFSVASNRKWTNADGTQGEEVTYIDCEASRHLGDHIAASIRKGMGFVGRGRLKSYQTELPQPDGTVKKIGRTKVVLTDGGPSLLFATAQVSKVSAGQNQGQQNYQQNYQQSQPAQQGYQQQAPAAQQSYQQPAQQSAPVGFDPASMNF